MNNQLTTAVGIKETLPTTLGYIGIGLAFGIVAQAAGFSIILIALMSIFIYAGSAQFITVSLLAVKSPVLSIVFATFLVNSRMILLSLTVAPFFKSESLLKNILIGSFLTDESFALGMNKLNHTNGLLNFSWFNATNLVSYITWVIASTLGASLGRFIDNPAKIGLDFAIVAMFIGLLYMQIISDKSMSRLLQILVVGCTLTLVYFGLIFIPSNFVVLVVTIISCLLGVVMKHAFF